MIGKLKIISKEVILGVLIVFFYFISRLVNLTKIPVFADEAIYIRWAQVMRAESTLRFLPLSDGKQPLFMWLIIPFLKIFEDPLVAGRLVSVFLGLGTMVGVFILSYLIFKKQSLSFFSSIFYLYSPFSFFFDRMALADGLLSFWGIWFLIFAVGLAAKARLDLAMIAGIILGLALITKSPALFSALLLPVTIILIDKKRKEFPINLMKLVILWGVIYLFSFAIYNVLRLGPEFHMIAIRNKDYVFPISEILKHPLNPFWGNFKDSISWFWILLTPFTFILGILGLFGILRKSRSEGIVLLIWFLIPLLAQSAVAKVNTARYLLFLVPPFLIFSAYGLEIIFTSLKNKVLTTLILIIIFFFPAYQTMLLTIQPALAWLPKKDRQGYLEIWTSGYGIKEASDYLEEIAETQNVLVGTEGYFGTLPDGLQIYLEKVPNITIIGVGYPIKEIPEKLINGLADKKVFLLVNDSRLEIKDTKKLSLVFRYPKAINPKTGVGENLLLFEILK